ncbi:hypothetical protein V6Z12_A07G223100, partial [Gossypium hirsutum]
DSFILNQSASDDTLAYPKVSSWKLEGQVGGDCCSWDGVECDNNTGHVIGLDLSSSFLYGSINSNNSLFQLHHLRRLNLSDNNFNRSEIPSAIGNLTRLSRLHLSWSGFTGQIPYEVLQLSNLVILDLSRNPLELRNPSLKILSERLVNLKHLDLHKVNVSSTIPQSLANLSALTYLSLVACELHGKFPTSLANLTQLTYLSLAGNEFSPDTLSWLAKLTKLTALNLDSTNSYGDVLYSLKNLTKLTYLDLSLNQFFERIPSWFGNLTGLSILDLGGNEFWGSVPQSIFTLKNLVELDLYGNHLSGTYKLETFLNLKKMKLQILDLSFNKLTGCLPSRHFQIWKAMKVVDLGKLRYFEVDVSFGGRETYWPIDFSYSMTMTKAGVELKYEKIQDFLVAIDLSSNKFDGCIPKDIQILQALQFLNLSNNFLSGPIPPSLGNLSNLQTLDLSQNKLSGEIPQELVQLTFLEFFNVSHNQLIGPIPQGKQFGTFGNSSFEGNLGLCGNPLSKKCYPEGLSPQPSSLSKKDDGEDSWLQFGWKAIMLGYGSGLVNGLILGYLFNPMKHKLFVKYFGRKIQSRRRGRMN